MSTAISPDAKASTLIPIIRENVVPDSMVYTDRFQVYAVVDVSAFHHRRVNHSQGFVSEQGHHLNGIENVGIRRNVICGVSMVSRKAVCTGFSKNVNGVSTVGARKRSYRSSEPGSGSKSPGRSYSNP